MSLLEKTALFSVENAGSDTKREVDTPLFRENPTTFSNFMAGENIDPDKDTIVHSQPVAQLPLDYNPFLPLSSSKDGSQGKQDASELNPDNQTSTLSNRKTTANASDNEHTSRNEFKSNNGDR